MSHQVPLTLYVLFHPASNEARDLADHLHDWFRLKQDDGDGTEAGLPIWYRSCIKQEEQGWRLTPGIPWDEARLNVLIVLADDQMVADPSWREALQAELDDIPDGGRNLVLPAPIDWSAYRLGFLFGTRNRLPAGTPRLDEEPDGVAPGDDEGKRQRAARILDRARELRRAATEAVTRQLRAVDGTVAPPNLDVFLSHAKADGAPIAERIRDGLADFGQLKTWYDANDLAPGYAWDPPMRAAVEGGTAALISVVTDAYPTRPWCRAEVNLARTPAELDLGLGSETIRAFTVQPSVAVTRRRERWSRPMAQLAQVPHLGWPEQEHAVSRRIEDVVDRLLLESLLVHFYRSYAPELAREHLEEGYQIALLTWVPDPWSLAHVRGQLLEAGGDWVLAYPGHGLRTAERRELSDLLEILDGPACEGNATFRLVSQERLGQLDLAPLPSPVRVALSAGGTTHDLEPAGIGVRHLDDLMVRLTRRLLEVGARVVYGGTLANYRANLTQALIDTARGWDALQSEPQPDDAARPRARATDLFDTPFTNFSSWPYDRFIGTRQRADLAGICTFVVVPDSSPVPSSQGDLSKPAHARLAADALTQMRHASTQDAHLRVVMGGKIRNWSGWVPGIAEEVACSLEAGQLPLIIGGFGGCAGELARFLGDPAVLWPESLSLDDARGDGPFSTLLQSDGAEALAKSRFEAVEAQLGTYREQLHGRAEWPFSVDRETVRSMLRVGSPTSAIEGVLRVLGRLAV
jgi:hypothetical protein